MAGVGGISGSYAKPSETAPKAAPTSSSLDMDSFMQLMAVQLQNQDMTSPMDNSEMMNQLTQMATVQAMNTFTDLATTQYSMSMIGQDVKVYTFDDKGNQVYIYGKVAGVDLAKNMIYLENDESGVGYGIGNIMAVGTVPQPSEDDEEKDDADTDKVENGGADDGADGPSGDGDGGADDSVQKSSYSAASGYGLTASSDERLVSRTSKNESGRSASAKSEPTATASAYSDIAARRMASSRTTSDPLKTNNSGGANDKVRPQATVVNGLEEKMRTNSLYTAGWIEKMGNRTYKATGPAAETQNKSVNATLKV